jgi:hypothetical protein
MNVLDGISHVFQGLYNARIEQKLRTALINGIDDDLERITGGSKAYDTEAVSIGNATLFDVWGFVSERVNKYNYVFNNLIKEIKDDDMERYYQLKILSYNEYLQCRGHQPPDHLKIYMQYNPNLSGIIGHYLSNDTYRDYAEMIKEFYPKVGLFFFKRLSIQD